MTQSVTEAMSSFTVTVKRSERAIRKLNRMLRPTTWHGVPMPVHGGTFFYCQYPIEIKLKKLDKLGRWTGRYYTATGPCLHRRRTFPAYVRHWRRTHERS